MITDPPLHLPPSTQPHTEASITCPIWVTQSNLDGIQALMQWCEGFEASGKGRVPGSFELTMFMRTIKRNIREHLDAQKPETQNETR